MHTFPSPNHGMENTLMLLIACMSGQERPGGGRRLPEHDRPVARSVERPDRRGFRRCDPARSSTGECSASCVMQAAPMTTCVIKQHPAGAHLWQVPKKKIEAKKAAVDPSGSPVKTGVGLSPPRPTRSSGAKVRSVK